MTSSKKEKNLKNIGKLVKGIIIGGAIGSVLGVTLAPKSGKETRTMLKKGSIKAFNSGSQMVSNIKMPKPGLSFFRGIRALLFGKKK
ncbi:MAG: YtxH domain-containing protein [Candidatus Gracilibacteria bacterium]